MHKVESQLFFPDCSTFSSDYPSKNEKQMPGVIAHFLTFEALFQWKIKHPKLPEMKWVSWFWPSWNYLYWKIINPFCFHFHAHCLCIKHRIKYMPSGTSWPVYDSRSGPQFWTLKQNLASFLNVPQTHSWIFTSIMICSIFNSPGLTLTLGWAEILPALFFRAPPQQQPTAQLLRDHRHQARSY